MPVKVRCAECQHIFAAPDAARGKAVKCPKCQQRVAVPAGKEAAAKSDKGAARKSAQAEEPAHQDDLDVLSKIDLSRAEDTSVRVCFKCGTEIAEDAMECPSCGIDLQSGSLSAAAKKKKALKGGVDPAMFFRVVWKDCWKFTKENWTLGLRTSLYTVIYTILTHVCILFSSWCWSAPPRVFWAALALICMLVSPGWLWYLNRAIIRAAIEKMERMPRVNFDAFENIALGIKSVVWAAAMGVQTLLIPGGIALCFVSPIAGMVVAGLGVGLLVLIQPMVMGHMAMPVTTRGWLMHHQLKSLGKTFGACAYWCVIAFVLSLPFAVIVAGTGIATRGSIREFSTVFQGNAKIAVTIGEKIAAKTDAAHQGKNAPPPDAGNPADLAKDMKPLPWKVMILPFVMLAVAQLGYGFAALFVMRANGLLALYFKRDLKLEAHAKEVKWVAKAKDDADGTGKKTKVSGGQAAAGIGGTLVFYIVLNVVVYFATGGKYVILPRWAAVMLKLADAAGAAPVDPGVGPAPGAQQPPPAAPMP